jgi:hypothetical protein
LCFFLVQVFFQPTQHTMAVSLPIRCFVAGVLLPSLLLLLTFLSVLPSAQSAPSSYYPLLNGVSFINSSSVLNALVGFRYLISTPIQPNQDLLFQLQCSNGRSDQLQARCSFQVSLRPDMLVTLSSCVGSWVPSTCRIPSCYFPSNSNLTVYIALSVMNSYQGQNATYNLTTTLETNTPVKSVSGHQFTMQPELWTLSWSGSQQPYCYSSTAFFSFDPSEVTPHSTLTFTGPTSLVNPPLTASTNLFFIPASNETYGFPPWNNGYQTPKTCQFPIFTASASQGFIAPPVWFQEVYKTTQATDWYAVYFFCVSFPGITGTPSISGTLSLTSPVMATVSVESTTTLTLPQPNDLLSFAYLEINSTGTGLDGELMNLIVDYASGSGPIVFAQDIDSQFLQIQSFTCSGPNTTFEVSIPRSTFSSSNGTASFVALYGSSSTPSQLTNVETATFAITLFNHSIQTSPVSVNTFPSSYTAVLDRFDFVASYSVQSDSANSFPTNVSVCLPPWPVLDDSATTQISITADGSGTGPFRCSLAQSLPSTQNPYNPNCVSMNINLDLCYSSQVPMNVTVAIELLPIALVKPIPINVAFTYWE